MVHAGHEDTARRDIPRRSRTPQQTSQPCETAPHCTTRPETARPEARQGTAQHGHMLRTSLVRPGGQKCQQVSRAQGVTREGGRQRVRVRAFVWLCVRKWAK